MAIRMRRSVRIDGDLVGFSRSIIGWVFSFDSETFVHYLPPNKDRRMWTAKRPPPSGEVLGTARTLTALHRQQAARYRAACAETQSKTAKAIASVAPAKTRKRFVDPAPQGKVYKVWIEIEEYDEETGHGETVDAPGASVATFDNYDEAWRFAERLNEVGERLDTEAGS